MENGFSLACGMDRGFPTKIEGRKPERIWENVIMISSHPEWKNAIENEEILASPVDLVRIFHEVLERNRRGPVLNLDDESTTVSQMFEQACRQLAKAEAPLRLSHLLCVARTERAAICLQLALLELMRLQVILLRQEHVVGDILIKKNARFDQVMNNMLATHGDAR